MSAELPGNKQAAGAQLVAGRDESSCKMGRLKAPARDEPGIDQHHRRAQLAGSRNATHAA